MSGEPTIAFGQQPCGFFPRRFLVAKIQTARRLQSQIGGRVVFFYHDSDHDSRETRTILRHRATGEGAALNFAVTSKVQRKFSPLYVKRIAEGWQERTARQLPNYVDGGLIEMFRSSAAETVGDFCLEMYRRLGWLDGIEVTRSGDPAVRRRACEVSDFFVDVPYEGEIVRARARDGGLQLHAGGETFVTLGSTSFTKEQISPARDTRFRWMQSVLRCTHYVAGEGEQAYLHPEEEAEIAFVPRDGIDRPDEAYTEASI
jgi:hypothetical protein